MSADVQEYLGPANYIQGNIAVGNFFTPSTGFGDKYIGISSAKPTFLVNYGTGTSDFGEFAFQRDGVNTWSFGATSNSGMWYVYNYTRGGYDFRINPNGVNQFFAPPAADKRINALTNATTSGQTVALALTNGTIFNLLCSTTDFILSVSGPSNLVFDFDLYVYNSTGANPDMTYGPTQAAFPDNTVSLPIGATQHFAMRWINGRVVIIAKTLMTGDCRQS